MAKHNWIDKTEWNKEVHQFTAAKVASAVNYSPLTEADICPDAQYLPAVQRDMAIGLRQRMKEKREARGEEKRERGKRQRAKEKALEVAALKKDLFGAERGNKDLVDSEALEDMGFVGGDDDIGDEV